jgi:hypothetical protein
MMIALKNLGIEGTYLNIIRALYEKPIANIILNGKILKPFPLKSVPRQGCLLSSLLFSIFLEFLGRPTRQGKEIEVIHTVNKEVKLSLFTGDILSLKDS